MTLGEARAEMVKYWRGKAQEALASANAELAAGRLHYAVNRAYYACFYAASALLLLEGRKFVKHTGVRAALHQWLIKPARLGKAWGEFYDGLFQLRGRADYSAMVLLKAEGVADAVKQATAFVAEMDRLIEGAPAGT
jgi:uncharacterized protein (UPF0332 family)